MVPGRRISRYPIRRQGHNLLAAAVLALVACGRDDLIPLEPRSSEDTFGKVTERWFQKQELWPWARPVIVGDLVIFGTGDQQLVARARSTGAARWSTRVSPPGAPSSIKGLDLIVAAGVVMAAVDRNVVGVDVATGSELWSYAPPPDTTARPTPGPGGVALAGLETDGSTVFIPAWGASVSALDVHSGATKWVWRPSPAPVFRSGAEALRLSGDTLFVNAWQGLNSSFTKSETWLVALDRSTGRELSRVVFPSYTSGTVVRGRPALWKNLVIVGSTGGRLFAVDRATSSIAWQVAPTEPITHGTDSGPTVYGDAVYADAGDDHLVALRAVDGTVIWRTLTRNSATTELLVTERCVFAPGGAFLDVVDRRTGRYLLRQKQPNELTSRDTKYGLIGGVFGSAAVAVNGEIYIAVAFGAWSFVEP